MTQKVNNTQTAASSKKIDLKKMIKEQQRAVSRGGSIILEKVLTWLENRYYAFMGLDLKIRLMILLYIVVIFYVGGVVVEIAFFFKNLFSPVKIQFEPHYGPGEVYGAWLFLDFNCTLFGLFVVFLISTFVTGFLYNHKRGIPEFKTISRNGQEINVVTNDTSVATGHPAWVEDIEEYFRVTNNPKKYNEPVYGKLEDGRYVIAKESEFDDENLNSVTTGSAGTGKSTYVNYPLIIRTAKTGSNMIITDPSSGGFKKLAKYLQSLGYNTPVLNIRDPLHSNAWNFVKDAGKSHKYAFRLADILLSNAIAGDPKSKNRGDFWLLSMKNLLTSLFLYTNIVDKENASMAKVMGYLKLNESTLNTKFEMLPQKNAAERSALTDFKQWYSMDKVPRSQVITTLGTYLNIFKDEDLLAILSKDDISIMDFYKPKEERKTALFIITSELEDTYSAIAGMFFDLAFAMITDRTVKEGVDQAPNKIQCILDEFANIGHINEMGKKLSTSRKYGFVIHLTLQSMPQFLDRYGANEQAEIMGNLSTQTLLGAIDPDTLEYYSNLFGTMPTYNQQVTKSGAFQFFTATMRSTIQARPIWMVDELKRLDKDKIIVLKAGPCPVADFYKIRYTELPEYIEFCEKMGGAENTEYPINTYEGVKITDKEYQDLANTLKVQYATTPTLPPDETNQNDSGQQGSEGKKTDTTNHGGSLNLTPEQSNSGEENPNNSNNDIFEDDKDDVFKKKSNGDRKVKNPVPTTVKEEIESLYKRDGTPKFSFLKSKREENTQLSIFGRDDISLADVNRIPKVKKQVRWEKIIENNAHFIAKDSRNTVRFITTQYRGLAGKPVTMVFFVSSDNTINELLPEYQLRTAGEKLDISAITAKLMEKIFQISQDYYIKYWNLIVNSESDSISPKIIELSQDVTIDSRHITLVPYIVRKGNVSVE